MAADSVSTKPYESPQGFHRHQCKNCDHVWEHSDECIANKFAHICPQCGQEQWRKYDGPLGPVSCSVRNGPIEIVTFILII